MSKRPWRARWSRTVFSLHPTSVAVCLGVLPAFSSALKNRLVNVLAQRSDEDGDAGIADYLVRS